MSNVYKNQVIADGAVAYWRLEESSGLSLADTVGSRTATLPAATGITYLIASILGDGSHGFAFDGAHAYPADFSAFSTGTTFSIEFLFTPNGDTSGYEVGFQTLLIEPGSFSGLYYRSDLGKFDYYYSGDHVSATARSNGVTYHVILSVNAGVGTWYINGVADGTMSSVPSINLSRLFSTGSGTVAEDPVKTTLLDEVALYSVALSSGQAANHYTLSSQRSPSSSVSASVSPSASLSPSSSRSPSVSASASVSASISPSGSLSPSVSASASISPSASASPSLSPSSSRSPSVSTSASVSPSSSRSPSVSTSASASPSLSPSASRSPSTSRSPSVSVSVSVSPSASTSPSASRSPSGSVSPSPGHIADVYLTIAGVHYATDRLDATKKILHETLRIVDRKSADASTCQFTAKGFQPTDRQEVIVCLGSDRIFAGTIRTIDASYVGTPANAQFDVDCSDFTLDMNSRKVLKRYIGSTATAIILDLIATYCPGYTTAGVTAGLPIIDEITFTNQEVTDCLTQIMNRIGGDWRCDYYRDVRAYLTDTASAPTDLTSSHPTLESISVTRDSSQVVTRALVEGYGSTAATAAAVGQTTLPVVDISPFNASGGSVRSGQQVLTYTGIASGATTVPGGGVTVVRPGPSTTPTLAPTNGLGDVSDETGDWRGKYTFAYDDGGESAPSSASNLATITDAVHAFLTMSGMDLGSAHVYSRRCYNKKPSGSTYVGDTSQTNPADPFTPIHAFVLQDNTSTALSYDAQTHGSTLEPPAAGTGYAAGAAYVYVSDLSAFSGAGGSAKAGSQVFTYGGRSAASGVGYLTGVSGISSTIAVGTTIGPYYAAGITSLPVSDTSGFSGSGGTARVGSQTFTYTGRSVASGPGNLTGIPASGAGALTAAVVGGDTVLVGAGGAGTLTGIPSSSTGSIVDAINEGDDVNIWIVVDDTAAQTALAALEASGSVASVQAANAGIVVTTTPHGFTSGQTVTLTGTTTTPTINGQRVITTLDAFRFTVPIVVTSGQAGAGGTVGLRDGVHEEYIQDRRISEAEANARGLALLDLRKDIEVRLHYLVRDYLTAAGKTVHVNLTYPTATVGDFLIQDVSISGFSESPDLYPAFDANTSTVRFTLEELLRMRRAA